MASLDSMVTDEMVLGRLRASSVSLTGAVSDYDPLLDAVGSAAFVLLGEATHGTHEFYRERAVITKRLILEKGFNAVAVEADWPDAYRVNRYVRGRGEDQDAAEALAGFLRFPTWMWRNADVLDFVGWLRAHNDSVKDGASKVGFYGLDLYSLHSSMAAVVAYLDKVDAGAAAQARERYACFDTFGEDTQAYGFATAFGMADSCEREVVSQLSSLRQEAASYAMRDGRLAEDDFFYAEQNAKVVRNAEQYYRMMYRGDVLSWNLRDQHMVETLGDLVEFLGRGGAPPKVVVWAHNSHLGDARATAMGSRGEHNVGQLVRQRWGSASYAVGFTTFTGTVTAASNWGQPAELKRVRPALPGSYESLFHGLHTQRAFVDLRTPGIRNALHAPRLERAIGVIYRPQTERASHYFLARLPDQFDAVLHFDSTRAVEPLERTAAWDAEAPETFPSGM